MRYAIRVSVRHSFWLSSTYSIAAFVMRGSVSEIGWSQVKPSSVGHKYISKDSHGVPVITSCPKHHISRRQPPAAVAEGLNVVFTYDVKWEESDIRWAERWDLYLTVKH